MECYCKRQYEEKMGQLDIRADCLRAVARYYEILNRENLIQWIEENPNYWEAIHSLHSEDITEDLASQVMTSLRKSHIVELQVLWLFKCSKFLDLAGKKKSS